MIEVVLAYGTFAYDEILQTQGWALMRNVGCRFHWGLNFNNASGAGDLVALMYAGSRDKWIQEQAKFNRKHTYTNDFLVLLGLSGDKSFLANKPL